jgi:hypothetical protein
MRGEGITSMRLPWNVAIIVFTSPVLQCIRSKPSCCQDSTMVAFYLCEISSEDLLQDVPSSNGQNEASLPVYSIAASYHVKGHLETISDSVCWFK